MIKIDTTLPTIDWQHRKKMNSKTSGLTEELFDIFLEQLPSAQSEINQAFAEKDFDELAEKLHKFHGSCAYCGLPRLKSYVAQFLTALRENIEPEQLWMDTLNEEIKKITAEIKAEGLTANPK